CRINSINNKKIIELLNIIEQSINSLLRLGYKIEYSLLSSKKDVDLARPLLVESYFDHLYSHNNGMNYTSDLTKDTYRLEMRDSVNSYPKLMPKRIIGLITAEIKLPDREKPNRIIGFSI